MCYCDTVRVWLGITAPIFLSNSFFWCKFQGQIGQQCRPNQPTEKIMNLKTAFSSMEISEISGRYSTSLIWFRLNTQCCCIPCLHACILQFIASGMYYTPPTVINPPSLEIFNFSRALGDNLQSSFKLFS